MIVLHSRGRVPGLAALCRRRLLSRSALVATALAAACVQAGAAGGAEVSSASPGGDRFVDVFREIAERLMREPRPEHPAATINRALLAWIVGERTGESRFTEFALAEYDAFLAASRERFDHDFHVSRPFGLLTLRLEGAGELSGERRRRSRDAAVAHVRWYLDERGPQRHFDCNIALADVLAVDCLARVFADDPALPAARVRTEVATLGRRILATGDLDENSSNYSSLGICFFLELARLEGWLDEVARSDRFRRMFERMRDIVSPSGSIPEYGDSYFRPRESRLDFVLLLEQAARLYDDGSFLEIARRLEPADATAVVEDDWLRAFMLADLEPFTPSRATVPPRSAVFMRAVPDGAPNVPDKLVLRAGEGAGAAMVMIDLYAAGSHAHPFKRPSIGFYEVGGVPLFHNLGRRGTSSGQCGNSFWALGRPELFPGHPRAGEWTTMEVPVTRCPPGSDPGARRIADGLDLRTFANPGLEYVRFDNLRLEGPAGVLLLDGFESGDSWQPNARSAAGARLLPSADHTEGKASQEVNLGVFGARLVSRLLERHERRGTEFRLAEYDTLKLDFVFAGRPPHCNLRRLFDEWVDLGERPLMATVAGATAVQAGDDAWGRVTFTDYLAPGGRLERRIVLTREGGLVVVDAFTPGERCRGWAAGQLWQLYELAERGEDWFASRSDGPFPQPGGGVAERRMIVKFMRTPGLACGCEQATPAIMHAPRADGTQRTTFWTAFSRQPVHAEPILGALAVLPIAADADAGELAAAVRLETLPGGGVQAELPCGDGRTLVNIGTGPDASAITVSRVR